MDHGLNCTGRRSWSITQKSIFATHFNYLKPSIIKTDTEKHINPLHPNCSSSAAPTPSQLLAHQQLVALSSRNFPNGATASTAGAKKVNTPCDAKSGDVTTKKIMNMI
jgi:hypothetical protein